MASALAERLASPAGRASTYYFTLFLTGAVAHPYLPIWLDDRGISTAEIGIINALPILVMVLLNILVGRIADRAADWRSTIVVGSMLAAVAPLGLVFVEGFWSILLVWTLINVPLQAIAPVVDAASMRMARRIGADFARIRVWGTIGFVIATVSVGALLDWRGAAVFVPVIVAVSLMRALAALQLPHFRSAQPAGVPAAEPGPPPVLSPLVATRLREAWRPWFILPLLGASLAQASHMLQMGFGALLWQQQGISGSLIGVLWALAPAAEVVAMLGFARMARRFTARHLLLAGCLCGMVRWAGFGLEPPVWGYALLQLLHMGSMALTFLGVVNFIANWTDERIAAEAQSFFVVIRQLFTVLALTGFGYLLAVAGPQSYFVAGAMAGLGAVLVLVSLRLMSPRREREAGGW